jgi:hypothetical protein
MLSVLLIKDTTGPKIWGASYVSLQGLFAENLQRVSGKCTAGPKQLQTMSMCSIRKKLDLAYRRPNNEESLGRH